MTQTTRWLRAAAAAISTLVVTSCYYDPSYSGSGSYDSGYYGGSGLNATFVYTSSDRWLYDPAVYCYYDRHRRCYYDPYLYGYYPVGYCPRPIYGARHPGGWNGRGNCPPPSGFRDRSLSNYENRVDQLKRSNYAWAQKVSVRNDSTAEAWRNQRSRAASNFQYSREAQQGRTQQDRTQQDRIQQDRTQQDRTPQMRDTRSERQQNMRGSKPDEVEKMRSQRGNPPPIQPRPFQPSRSQPRATRPGYNEPVATGSASRQGRPTGSPQQQTPQRQERQPAQRSASPQSQDNGDRGSNRPGRMEELRSPRGQ